MLVAIPIVVALFGVFSSAINSRLKNKTSVFYYTTILFLILLAGLRNPDVFPDMENYEYFFAKDDLLISNYGTDAINAGYRFFNSLGRSLLGNFQLYCFLIACIIVSGYSWFIRRYSAGLHWAWIALILFVLINYCQTLFLLRQFLATFFCLGAYRCIMERKQIVFWFLTLLAISFHATAAVIIPLYYLYGINPTKQNIRLILVLAGVGAVLFYAAVSLVLNMLGGYYSHYLNHGEAGASWQRAAMKIFILLVYLYALGGDVRKLGINYLVLLFLITSAVICIGGMNLYGVYRLREFFSIGEILGIPIILRVNINNPSMKKWLVYGMVFVYIGLLLVSYRSFVLSDNFAYGYRFFFE